MGPGTRGKGVVTQTRTYMYQLNHKDIFYWHPNQTNSNPIDPSSFDLVPKQLGEIRPRLIRSIAAQLKRGSVVGYDKAHRFGGNGGHVG